MERCDFDRSEERILKKSFFTRSKNAPPPSQVQFMPTVRNITAYLAIIHMLIFSQLDREGSLKSEIMCRL